MLMQPPPNFLAPQPAARPLSNLLTARLPFASVQPAASHEVSPNIAYPFGLVPMDILPIDWHKTLSPSVALLELFCGGR